MRLPAVILLVLLCQFSKAQHARDSLLRSWNDPQLPDSVRLESLDELIWSVYMDIQPDSAAYFSNLEYDFAAARGDRKYMSFALNALGSIYIDWGNFDKALDYHSRALAIRKEMKDQRQIAVSLNNIGRCYYKTGQWSMAAEYYFRALKIREKAGDKRGMATSLGNIGAVYQQQGNKERAMDYHKRSLQLSEEIDYKPRIIQALNNLSFLYKERGDTSSALQYQLRSAAISRESGNIEGLSSALHGLGNTYCELGNLDAADSCQQLALKMREQLRDTNALSFSYYSLSEIAWRRKNMPQCFSYGKLAMSMAIAARSLRQQHNIGLFLYERYKEAGNFPDALRMLELVRTLNDSMESQNLEAKLYEEQLKYDFEKRELREKLASERAQMMLREDIREERDRKRLMLAGFGGIFLVLIIAGLFYFRFTRQKAVIAEQKNNLLKQKLLIAQINPHFIFNSLNAIQNFIFSRDSLEAGTYLGRFAGLMRMILNFSREDFISVSSELHFLSEYLGLQQLRFREKFSFTLEVDESIEQDDTFIPPMLMQPFVENAIEHGIMHKAEGGVINVRIFREGGLLYYEVEDNGVGLEASQQRRTKIGSAHQSLATVITRERMAALGNRKEQLEISIIDKEKINPSGSGVKVRFAVPYQLH
jgi:tetratricopeptide (TPR) repeat protein